MANTMTENPRARVPSEIGELKRCMSCGECWPADPEFFAPAKACADGLSRRCLACVSERVWAFMPTAGG
ncbi:hypothetical protein [Pseudoduganella namucuonensis]|uniref:Uncharacterized protein n=1 Tax=Pseudoduganella namucuonensis TaxID=1035707 RepID=A0A1I7LSK7_9BURK|nr:hypothetical protein [Pseudoduganella namucuonensis]SFV12663.1 hypothetical protein SAMN05216552_103679 [Pseudoduganella namucuonensis]